MKRLALPILCLVITALLPSLTTLAQDVIAAGDRVLVTSDRLPVYARPDSSSLVVSELASGMQTRVITDTADASGVRWLYLESAAYGWVPLSADVDAPLRIYTDALNAQLIADSTSAIAADPSNVTAYATRGHAHSNAGDSEAALADFTAAISLTPSEGRLYEFRGRLYYHMRRYSEATNDLVQARNLGRDLPNTANLLALSFREGVSSATAAAEYMLSANRFPEYGLLYYNWGTTLFHMGDYASALEKLNQSINLDPYNADAYSYRAGSYENLGDFNAAAADYDFALSVDPSCVSCLISRAAFVRDPEAAIDDLNRAIELDPTWSRAYSNRAANYVFLGHVDLAIEDLKYAIELNPDEELAYYNLAALYGMLGEYSSAMSTYDEVVAQRGEFDNSARLYRAQVYIALNQLDSALADVNTYWLSLAYTPENLYFHNTVLLLRAVIELRRGEYRAAARDYRTAMEQAPEFVRSYYMMGNGYRVTPLREAQITELQTQVAASPSADLYLELANLQMEFGVWAPARESYQQALALGAQAPGLAEFIQEMQGILW